MNASVRFVSLGSLLLLLLAPPSRAAGAELELADGDRVVFLGDGLVEQAQYFGWVEVMMTTAYPDRDITFRNLGWSADTPAGDSRIGLSLVQAGKEPPEEGWKQLQKQLELTQPTVLVLGYGMTSSLENGADGVDRFAADYRRLVRTAREISPGVRFLFLSPLTKANHVAQFNVAQFSELGSGQPADKTELGELGDNTDEAHAAVIARYAEVIRDLAEEYDSPYADLTGVALRPELRKDPIHLNGRGYRHLASVIESALGWDGASWQDHPQTEPLGEVILRKNRWWFHRSRPANMAYVFGFRKHEQGQNADEIPQFDALVAEEEQRIAQLRHLEPAELAPAEPRLESQYAEFEPQETPEFILGEDLEVTLWAENPLLNKPIHMNFDPQGRLWVASSEAYPMIEVGQAPPDKILVLEDTTGDGKADESAVFADGLLIPTGVVPGDDGVYVAQSTDLLHLRDTDGDGRADTRRRVLSGFGTEDTHHNLHTLLWGPDGRLYMNQSVYTRTNTETPHGVVRLKAGGGFRYDPRSMRTEIFFRGLWNAWGHQFNRFGQSFLTDGAGFQGIAYAFPGATFHPTPGASRNLGLISPGSYPKFCSLEIVSGDSFPPAWQGSVITCDFRANRVTRFSLEPRGAGYVTEQQDDLMRSSASTFRPVDVKQGPDGALYIADWSNPIINHGEVDFRDERRDRWHGRIWRVTWKGADAKPKVNLRRLETPELLDNLRSADRYTRDQSRRVLIERGGTEAALDRWVAEQEDEAARLQAMWLYQALGSPQKLPTDLLTAEQPRIRAAAVRVIGDFVGPAANPADRLSWSAARTWLQDRVVDEHPHVRLEAVRALGKLGTAEAAALALEALTEPTDRFLEFALATTVQQSAEPLMAAIESGRWVADTPQREKRLAFVLSSVDPARAAQFLAQRLHDAPLPADGSGPWIELIAQAGGPEQLDRLYEQAVQQGFQAEATARALRSLADAARLRKVRPSGPPAGFERLLESDQAGIQQAAAELAGAWELGDQVDRLAMIASDRGTSPAVRRAAIDAIGSIGGQPATDALAELAGDRPERRRVRRQAVVALAGLDGDRAAAPFYALLEGVESEQQALALWRDMLAGQGVGQTLAANLPADGVSTVAARAGVAACRDGGREEPELLAALMPLSGLTMTAEALTPERIQEMSEQVVRHGNPVRGESIYRREELACVTCHAIGGVGGKVGPDMTSLGASAPLDYLIESLFDPNAKIKEGYHAVTVLTADGMIVNGIETESTDEELVLREASNELIRIPRADLIDTKPGQSLMPTGAVDRLSRHEQIDLLAFLSRLGKPGRFDASSGGVARVYDVFAGTHRIEQEGAERIITGQLDQGWKPLAARVDGTVMRGELQARTQQPKHISLVHVYLRTRIQVATDAAVRLSVSGAESADVWIDAEPVEGETLFQAELEAGEHTVLVRLDARQLPENFQLTSDDVVFATE